MTNEEFETKFRLLADDISHYRDCITPNSNVKSKLLYDGGNDNLPLYSIVIPTSNRSNTLITAIKSAITQSSDIDYEIIVVDNTEDLETVVEKLNLIKQLRYPGIKYYVNEKNIGMAGNFNRCFELAKAPWVAMLHDDDILHKDFLKNLDRCLQRKKSKKIGVIRPRKMYFKDDAYLPIDEKKYDGWMTKISRFETLLRGLGPTAGNTCGTVIYRKAFFESGGYNNKLYPSLDHVVGYQIQKLGYSAYHSHDVMGYYRIAINESTKTETFKGFALIDTIFRRTMYRDNKLYGIYGKLFEGAHYRDMLFRLKKHSEIGLISDLDYSDIDFLKMQNKYSVRYFMLRALRKIIVFKHSI